MTTGPKMPAPNDNESSLTPDLAFTDAAAIFDRADKVDRLVDCLIVGNVSTTDFHQIEAERDRRGRRIRLFFLPDQACAIVTIPTGPHEQAHVELYYVVRDSLKEMGLANEWQTVAAETFAAASRGSGEGDSGGGPLWRDDGGGIVWPTIVIQAGVSQSMASLRAKANWWFAASDNRMKIVVLIKVTLTATESSIAVETWTATATARHTGRPGATTTRSFVRSMPAVMEPSCQQRVDISWPLLSPIRNPPRRDRVRVLFSVVGAPMVFGFEELMLRPPVPAHGEHDILITEADFQDIASRVWGCL
ncbi:hypothetical protein SPBR_07665 [Sporothrix brasiliensis 5110]|uniref:Uncharacterized protein n=1 Tax=Sporothrix brasiliensis 5110 TaxID=1398154 RepID=A0A0C2EQX2_9PEZI|nr:uncharacterized protein SPBR_07665 [Sporothrix brasiliensis 5110]KIH88734.1 hypothetical protein SPBR_07665 [Sporothrix brasiliensis 5110]